jgi:1,4-alpha-glucan branching enzyme
MRAFECDDEINSGQHIRWGAAVFISQKQSTVNRYFVKVPLGWREVLGWIPWPDVGGRHF